jgi:hypothetical protein
MFSLSSSLTNVGKRLLSALFWVSVGSFGVLKLCKTKLGEGRPSSAGITRASNRGSLADYAGARLGRCYTSQNGKSLRK